MTIQEPQKPRAAHDPAFIQALSRWIHRDLADASIDELSEIRSRFREGAELQRQRERFS